jgi:hypothetical protein
LKVKKPVRARKTSIGTSPYRPKEGGGEREEGGEKKGGGRGRTGGGAEDSLKGLGEGQGVIGVMSSPALSPTKLMKGREAEEKEKEEGEGEGGTMEGVRTMVIPKLDLTISFPSPEKDERRRHTVDEGEGRGKPGGKKGEPRVSGRSPRNLISDKEVEEEMKRIMMGIIDDPESEEEDRGEVKELKGKGEGEGKGQGKGEEKDGKGKGKGEGEGEENGGSSKRKKDSARGKEDSERDLKKSSKGEEGRTEGIHLSPRRSNDGGVGVSPRGSSEKIFSEGHSSRRRLKHSKSLRGSPQKEKRPFPMMSSADPRVSPEKERLTFRHTEKRETSSERKSTGEETPKYSSTFEIPQGYDPATVLINFQKLSKLTEILMKLNHVRQIPYYFSEDRTHKAQSQWVHEWILSPEKVILSEPDRFKFSKICESFDNK